jgi:sterol desaturase/sphingolipid hydroxylase (fatty acid hydroxylase superfamily)
MSTTRFDQAADAAAASTEDRARKTPGRAGIHGNPGAGPGAEGHSTSQVVGPDQRRELIRRLGSSTFNYWFGYVANLSLVGWMVSHAFPGGRSALGAFGFASAAILGLLSWTLSEFLLHRYVYHLWPSFLTDGHDLHHKRPRDLIGVPWYLTTIAVILLFESLTMIFPPAPTAVILGFNWLGYVGYCIAHHASHHWNLRNAWLVRMKVHHLVHHRHPEFNWGFTTTFWDHLFGTAYKLPPKSISRAVRANMHTKTSAAMNQRTTSF